MAATAPQMPWNPGTPGGGAGEDDVAGGWTGGDAALEEQYEVESIIGSGVFGTVYKARCRSTGRPVALKRLRFDDDVGDGVPAHLIREVSILRDFQHQNVVRLYDIHVTGLAEYNLVFEYIDNDLNKVLKGYRRAGEMMPLEMVVSYAKDLLSGCDACHVRLILHRDLKPQNILVSPRGLKICDFGLARVFSPPLKAYTHDVVTLWYRAPEILLGTQVYGPEVDVWSAGCCIAEMGTCQPVFPGDSEIGTIFKILRLQGTPTEESYPGFSRLEHWRDTFPCWPPTGLAPILDLRPELGPSCRDLLAGLLALNPQARATARRAKRHPWFQEVGQVGAC